MAGVQTCALPISKLPASTEHYVTEELELLELLVGKALSALAEDLLRKAGIL